MTKPDKGQESYYRSGRTVLPIQYKNCSSRFVHYFVLISPNLPFDFKAYNAENNLLLLFKRFTLPCLPEIFITIPSTRSL